MLYHSPRESAIVTEYFHLLLLHDPRPNVHRTSLVSTRSIVFLKMASVATSTCRALRVARIPHVACTPRIIRPMTVLPRTTYRYSSTAAPIQSGHGSNKTAPSAKTDDQGRRPPPAPPGKESENLSSGQEPASFLGTQKRLPEFNLADRVILVSGGARGLGLTQAEALMEAGATG